jgi:poly(A) polymerase
MKLGDAAWRHQPGLDRLLDALDARAGTTRFVGGAVRDTLLGLPVKDIDLATRLLPDESAARIREAGFKAVPTGLAHGTVTAVLPQGPVEVTTLRRDVSTDGRHATIAFTDDWREDAVRRDFTMNALFADPQTGEITDYVDGTRDIGDRRVRFIGDPLTRIAEDHLRILRFFRFHARFGAGAPDPDGLAACAHRANDLMALSRERIADEILKLLATADPAPVIALMLDCAILAPVVPEIDAAGVERLARLVRREEETGTADPLRRMAALLPAAPRVALGVAQRLRLSKAAQKRLIAAAERSPADSGLSADELAYRMGPQHATDRILLEWPDPHAALDRLATWSRPLLGVTGGDLIARGLPAGPLVAATLQELERRWIAAGFPAGGWARDAAASLVAQVLRDRQ